MSEVNKNYSKMLKTKAGLSDQRGSAWTKTAEGHMHVYQVVMNAEGQVAPDFDAVPGFEYGISDYVDRHYHLILPGGKTGPANEQEGGHTHEYVLPISGEGIFD